MPESLRTRLARWGFNLFPAYVGTGARITYIASDWMEAAIALPLSWRTRNYVGTVFGGSMYAAVDPIYMVMLIKILGSGYRVWDKAATIRFLKPGRATLRARFVLTHDEIAAIRSELESARAIERVYTVELTDGAGTVHARVEKTLFLRRSARRPASPECAAQTEEPD